MSALRMAAMVAAVVATTTLFEARTAMAADGDKLERTVSVSASGTVTAEPDIAHISAGVTTEGEGGTPRACSLSALSQRH